MNRILTKLLWLPVAGAGFLACSSSGSGPNTPASSSGDVSCANDALLNVKLGPLAPATLPLTRAGDKGALQFVLVDPMTPNPPSQDSNSWTLKVVDPTGKALDDVAVSFPNDTAHGASANPWMPKMGHGSVTPKATNNGDGTYAISNLYFTMPGIWQLTVKAQSSSASATDSTMLSFCVP